MDLSFSLPDLPMLRALGTPSRSGMCLQVLGTPLMSLIPTLEHTNLLKITGKVLHAADLSSFHFKYSRRLSSRKYVHALALP